jgi:hypothetical protein
MANYIHTCIYVYIHTYIYAPRGLSTANDSTAGGGRRVPTAPRPPSMSMDLFVQTNPYVRQLQAEGDCLHMREYILEKVCAHVCLYQAVRAPKSVYTYMDV